ncbi:hypothetical protein HW537_10890 [Asaia siamensis]
MSEQREGSGILLTNRQKRSDRSPDYTGTVTINGNPYEISGWNKTGRNGGAFITLSLRIPQPCQQRTQKPTKAQIERAEAQRRRMMTS